MEFQKKVRKTAAILFILILCSNMVAAVSCPAPSYDYVGRLLCLLLQLLCVILYVVVPVLTVLLLMGGLMQLSGTAETRDKGKHIVKNAIIGIIIIAGFVFLAGSLTNMDVVNECELIGELDPTPHPAQTASMHPGFQQKLIDNFENPKLFNSQQESFNRLK